MVVDPRELNLIILFDIQCPYNDICKHYDKRFCHGVRVVYCPLFRKHYVEETNRLKELIKKYLKRSVK